IPCCPPVAGDNNLVPPALEHPRQQRTRDWVIFGNENLHRCTWFGLRPDGGNPLNSTPLPALRRKATPLPNVRYRSAQAALAAYPIHSAEREALDRGLRPLLQDG